MQSIWNVLAAQGATGKASSSNDGTANPEAFAKELNARFKELTTQAEKIQASLQSLAKAFPSLPIRADGGSSAAATSATSQAATASRTSVTISSDLLAGLGENEEAANAIREMLETFFASLDKPGAIDGKAFESNVWRSMNIGADGARFVDTHRDSSGKTTLAVSTLSLNYNQAVASMFDQLVGGTASSSASRTGGAGSSRSTQGVFGDSWQYSAYFSYSSASFFDRSSLGGSTASLGRVQVSAQIMVAIREVQAQVGGAEMEGEFSWFAMAALGLVDPLVLDLGGEGFNLRAMEDGVRFDMRGEGAAVRTGFIQGDDAFLYLDENGNGVADDVTELFGDGGGFANGFEKLARYDANGDGVIDENDAIYPDLRLWRDLNGDGVNQAEESMTLAEAGIGSIDLGYERRYEADGKGNVVGERSSFTRTDGTRGAIADVWFRAQ